MNLSTEQEKALIAFKNGKNIFLTGPGGSGKTELIKRMVEIANNNNKNIQVCALTGCATVLLKCGNPKTIHSWAGIGLASENSNKVIDRVIKNSHKRKNWNKVEILIIDEISMMSKKIFEILDIIGRKIKKKMLIPFGGIQVIFSGDFYQLPPIGDEEDEESMMFCFESPMWEKTIDEVIQLTTIFRQTDQDYKKILNQIRVGKLYKSSYEKLMTRVNIQEKINNFNIKPTILLPRRKDVDFINLNELMKLKTEIITYNMKKEFIDINKINNNTKLEIPSKTLLGVSIEEREIEIKKLIGNIMVDEKIELRIGAQVMCIANIDLEQPYPIVNGSQGIIIDICRGLPVVQFTHGQKRIIDWHTWTSEKIIDIAIKQIPLICAWAITIHKAQGITLELAEIDAGKNIFECGQTYVALSRVKALDGLYLTNFDPTKIKVNKKVQEFYKTLS